MTLDCWLFTAVLHGRSRHKVCFVAAILIPANFAFGEDLGGRSDILGAIGPTESLLRDSYDLRLEARGNLGDFLQAQLAPVGLGEGIKSLREWNEVHPLMAIPEVPAAPLAGVSVEANVAFIADIATVSPILAKVIGVSLLQPGGEWDYKIQSSLIVSVELATDFGNFNAGAVGYTAGASDSTFDTIADWVQHYQDSMYTYSDLVSDRPWGEIRRRFGERFRGDDPQGKRFVALGRSWVRATEYRAFLQRTIEGVDSKEDRSGDDDTDGGQIAPGPYPLPSDRSSVGNEDRRLWRDLFPDRGSREPESAPPPPSDAPSPDTPVPDNPAPDLPPVEIPPLQ